VSVKLVSEPGVGTIACGVAKAYADFITVSGYDGGTGASPLTSVKYAGSPGTGPGRTQQALVANGLRHKVRLQVDGGLKTGLDMIKAAILGAELRLRYRPDGGAGLQIPAYLPPEQLRHRRRHGMRSCAASTSRHRRW
jgi:hypothetical protein